MYGKPNPFLTAFAVVATDFGTYSPENQYAQCSLIVCRMHFLGREHSRLMLHHHHMPAHSTAAQRVESGRTTMSGSGAGTPPFEFVDERRDRRRKDWEVECYAHKEPGR